MPVREETQRRKSMEEKRKVAGSFLLGMLCMALIVYGIAKIVTWDLVIPEDTWQG